MAWAADFRSVRCTCGLAQTAPDVFASYVRHTCGSLGSWTVAGGSGSLLGPGYPWASAFIAGSASNS